MPVALLLQDFLQRRFYAAFLIFGAGSLAALSMAPLNFWPVLFLSLPLLYLGILNAKSLKSAFVRGWLFAFGYFVFSLSWIGNALLVDGNPYLWAWPLAVSGLPALLAFFPAFACLAAKKFLKLETLWGILGFSALYAGVEWLRGHLFTGFPWNLFGYTWADHLHTLQILYLSDVYFLTWLTLLWALSSLVFLLPQCSKKFLIVPLSLFGIVQVYGLLSLQDTQFNENVRVVLVQPNIDQAVKWDGDKLYSHFEKHIALSQNVDKDDIPALIIWPETAMSYRVLETKQAQADIGALLQSYPERSSIITGILNYDRADKTYSNSMIEIDRNVDVKNTYNKHHLVPFGEYIPFQELIPLTPVVQFKGFKHGQGLEPIQTQSAQSIIPLICYEVLFPGKIKRALSRSNDMIINITNDAWYGDSAGPRQHLTKAVFRAIETGLPLARVANTGITAFIDPYGRKLTETETFTEHTDRLFIPQRRDAPQFFGQYKHVLIAGLFALLAMFSMTIGAHNTNRD